jgi:hypothetical protein
VTGRAELLNERGSVCFALSFSAASVLDFAIQQSESYTRSQYLASAHITSGLYPWMPG